MRLGAISHNNCFDMRKLRTEILPVHSKRERLRTPESQRTMRPAQEENLADEARHC